MVPKCEDSGEEGRREKGREGQDQSHRDVVMFLVELSPCGHCSNSDQSEFL